MSLGKKQEKFARMYTLLLIYIHSLGYNVRLGHVLRCQDCKTGKDTSLHKLKLAADINLFKDDVYLTSAADHKRFGLYWEELGGSWGGRFGESSPGAGDGWDGNHYSLEHNGYK